MKAPEAPPLPEELVALLRRMRLPYLRKAAPEVCATARAQRWDPAEVLRVLLAEEVAGRDSATRTMRRRAAGVPSGKTFDSWRAADRRGLRLHGRQSIKVASGAGPRTRRRPRVGWRPGVHGRGQAQGGARRWCVGCARSRG